jgi:protein gp37
MTATRIPYGTKSWNPIDGCLPDFPCWDRCWARRMNQRFGDGKFEPTFHPKRLFEPLKWKKPQVVLLGFCGDMFADCSAIGYENVLQILDIIEDCKRHRFLLLTKRVEKAIGIVFPDNLWLGTSVSTQADADERIPELLKVDCKHKWLSVEPLLEDINFSPTTWNFSSGIGITDRYLSRIDWLVIGGETFHGARPAKVEWFKHISDQCKDAGISYYWKQWGTALSREKEFINLNNWDSDVNCLTRRELPKELQHD